MTFSLKRPLPALALLLLLALPLLGGCAKSMNDPALWYHTRYATCAPDDAACVARFKRDLGRCKLPADLAFGSNAWSDERYRSAVRVCMELQGWTYIGDD